MENATLGRLSLAVVVVSIVAGVTLILLSTSTLAAVGTVLIIIGLVGLMPTLRYTLWNGESPRPK